MSFSHACSSVMKYLGTVLFFNKGCIFNRNTNYIYHVYSLFILLRYTQMSTSYVKEMSPIIVKTFYSKPQMHECIKSGANPVNCPGPKEMLLLLHDICFINLKRSESILTWLGIILNTLEQTSQSHHCSCENIPYIFRPRKIINNETELPYIVVFSAEHSIN